MIKPRFLAILSTFVLAIFGALANNPIALGQSSSPQSGATADAKRDQLNFEVQLHLLVASNEKGGVSKIPPVLEAVVRQLKPALPFGNYNLAATFVNRVKDGGSLELKGVVSSDSFAGGMANSPSQTFYEFTLFQVKSTGPETNPLSIDINKFRFGLRLPVTMGISRTEGNTTTYPIINYEPTGITTEITLREGSPTVVGTMTTGKPDQILILVISIKRTP